MALALTIPLLILLPKLFAQSEGPPAWPCYLGYILGTMVQICLQHKLLEDADWSEQAQGIRERIKDDTKRLNEVYFQTGGTPPGGSLAAGTSLLGS